MSDVAGTTHDPVDESFVWRGNSLVTLIDTAGVRKKSKQEEGLERASALWSIKTIERSQVSILMIDGEMGMLEQDFKLAMRVIQEYKSLLIVVNKADLMEQHDSQQIEKVRLHLHFLALFLADTLQRFDRRSELCN